jgi:4-amino-4-deoxy-L-arabinose transferase-like glycosyltransferase/thioredoxin-like negative regulator of GroEL
MSMALLLLATLAVKATVLAQLGEHPLLQPHGELDTSYYIELAQRIASGGVLAVPEPFVVSPLYAYLLAAVFRLGGSVLAAQVLQILLGTAAVGLLFATARLWFGARAAWLSAGLAALTGIITFYEILILQAALDPFLVALSLYLVSLAATEGRPWLLAAGGIATGLLVLNRPNALAYAAFVAVVLACGLWTRRAHAAPWPALRRALVFPAALLLTLAPNLARNYAASGEWIVISSHGGLNFYIGNNPQADGIYTRLPGIAASIAGQARDARRAAEQAAGRPLSAAEVSDHYYGLAWDWIASQPGAAFRLFGRKLALLVNRVDVPLNYSYAYYSREEATLLRALPVGAWLLVPLGLVGLFVRPFGHTRSGYWTWASFVPLFGLTVAAFFVTDRYRMPLLVPLCASSGYLLVWAWDRLRERRVAPLGGAVSGVAVLAVLAGWPLGLDDGRGFEQTRQAVWFVEQERYADARGYIARIAPMHSHPGVLRYQAGRAFATASRYEDAIEQFSAALAIDRGQAAIELELGETLTVAGRAAEAVPHLTAALAAGHRAEIAAPWLVRALVASGQSPRAVELIAGLPEQVAASGPETALDLGTMALELQAPAVAERWLRLAVAAEPSRAEAHLNLAVALAMLGRVEEARSHALEVRRLDPSEPRAEALLTALGRRPM